MTTYTGSPHHRKFVQDMHAVANRKADMFPITLKTRFEQLVHCERQAGKRPTSYKLLADACNLSKSTDHYHARTSHGHRAIIAQLVMNRLEDYLPSASEISNLIPAIPPAPATRRPHPVNPVNPVNPVKRANRRPRLARVTPHGYLFHRGAHYFAGSAFAGIPVHVRRLRASDYLEISAGNLRRIIAPIDPAGNQLGYYPEHHNAR
jgi:hypothetical protein